MAKIDEKSGSETPEQADSLSATGMFLRAFETKPETAAASGGSAAPAQAGAGPDPFGPSGPARSAFAAPEQASGTPQAAVPASAPGEFTRFLKTLEPRASGEPMPAGPLSPVPPSPAAASVSSAPIAHGGPAPGEFTRIFVSGKSPTPGSSPKKTDELPGLPPAAASSAGAKGLSSPGVSDSASGAGSFTQYFNASASGSASRSVPPAPSPATGAEPLRREGMQPVADTPAAAGPSVTSLLSSLSSTSAGNPTGAGRQEPGPYRPAARTPFAAPAPAPAEPGAEPGGVTRLIQKLAQQPAAPPAPAVPAPPSPLPVNSGPGEFTRMIAKIGAESAPVAQSAPAEPPAPAAPATFQIPVPAMQAPPVPAAPHIPAAPAMPAPLAPKLAPAPAPAIPAPPALKLPPVAIPAPPKTKLESMVPVLLVINTFLLLVLLVVVLFLAKGR